jgi:hypothetical protein
MAATKQWYSCFYRRRTSQVKPSRGDNNKTSSDIKAAANNDQIKPQLHRIMHTKSCHVQAQAQVRSLAEQSQTNAAVQNGAEPGE